MGTSSGRSRAAPLLFVGLLLTGLLLVIAALATWFGMTAANYATWDMGEPPTAPAEPADPGEADAGSEPGTDSADAAPVGGRRSTTVRSRVRSNVAGSEGGDSPPTRTSGDVDSRHIATPPADDPWEDEDALLGVRGGSPQGVTGRIARPGGDQPLSPTAAWFKSHQYSGGSWDALRFTEECDADVCSGAGAVSNPAGDTALVALALLALDEGKTFQSMNKGLRSIRNRIAEDGWIERPTASVAVQGQAALAFITAYRASGSRLHKSGAERLLAALVKERLDAGGWPAQRDGQTYDPDGTLWAVAAISAGGPAEAKPLSLKIPPDRFGQESWSGAPSWDGSPYDAARRAFIHLAINGNLYGLADGEALLASIIGTPPRWDEEHADPLYWIVGGAVMRTATAETQDPWFAALTTALDRAFIRHEGAPEHGSSDPLGTALEPEGRLRATALATIARRVAAAPAGRPFDWGRVR